MTNNFLSKVPLEVSIKVSVDNLNKIREPNVEKINFISCSKIETCDVQFSLNNVIYNHKRHGHRIAVGPNSVKIAQDPSSQVVYIKYGEECLVILKTESEIEAIFQKLNS